MLSWRQRARVRSLAWHTLPLPLARVGLQPVEFLVKCNSKDRRVQDTVTRCAHLTSLPHEGQQPCQQVSLELCQGVECHPWWHDTLAHHIRDSVTVTQNVAVLLHHQGLLAHVHLQRQT